MPLTANDIIQHLDLRPHPEGGYYREIFRSPIQVTHADRDAMRSACTSIYFLLPEGDCSAFHRVIGADEIWHLYAGGPLELHLIDSGGDYESRILHADPMIAAPMSVVPAGCWQAARPAPGVPWVLCGCTVAPGFDFKDFEMPECESLVAQFPVHEALIRSLGRAK